MKWLKRIGKGIIVLVVVLIAAHTIATVVLGYMVKMKIAAIKAKGEPVSFADLNREKIPDSENAAVIYMRVIKAYREPAVSDRWFRPFSKEWRKQGAATPNLWREVGQALESQQGIIDQIEAAASRPKCRYPISLDANGLPIFSHYARMKHLEQLLSVNASYNAANGDMDEAVRSIELGFKLSESLKDDPLIIGFLVRISLIRIVSASIKKSLEYGDISESQAKYLFDLLADIDLHSDYENVIVGERVVGIEGYERIRRKGYSGIIADIPKDRYVISDRLLKYRLLGPYAGRPFSYAQELDYLKEMSDQIEIASLPSREAMNKKSKPTFDRARGSHISCATRIAGSQILLALAAYKDRYGSYPETLAELKSKLGWKLPEDPFSGKDFLYKRQGNGYLLYSVGLNLKDDGGSEEYIQINKNDREQADIIWRTER